MGWRKIANREHYLVGQLRAKARSGNERNLKEQLLKAEAECRMLEAQMIRAHAFGQRFYEMWSDTCINSDTSYFEEKWKQDVLEGL